MEKQFRQALYATPIAFLAMSAWLATTKATYELQLIVAVAAITILFGVLLVWFALAWMRRLAESDPLEELANTYRHKLTDPGPEKTPAPD